MMTFTISLSAYIPVAKRDDANTMLEALGYGPNNFSIELAPEGVPAITHYGFHAVDNGRVVDALAGNQALPEGAVWTDYGLTDGKVSSIISAIETHPRGVGSGSAVSHFDAGAQANGVRRMIVEEEV